MTYSPSVHARVPWGTNGCHASWRSSPSMRRSSAMHPRAGDVSCSNAMIDWSWTGSSADRREEAKIWPMMWYAGRRTIEVANSLSL
eukprot:15433653-Alexandrium_andersonii.AAC.1